MCLQINGMFHKLNIFGYRHALKAKEDIFVYKNISYSETIGYYTPYMHYPIYFTNGECVCCEKGMRESYKDTSISIGIHSYVNQCAAFLGAGVSYRAIIPKGSRFYIGIDHTIVSDKLIIYRNNSLTALTINEYIKKYLLSNNYVIK